MNKEVIKILEANNELLRENIAMNLENEKLSEESILQINSNVQFIDKLKEIKLPKVEEYKIVPLKCIVDRYKRPFNIMTPFEIEHHLLLELRSIIAKTYINFQERIGNYEASLFIGVKKN